jgi:hypothetical protein
MHSRCLAFFPFKLWGVGGGPGEGGRGFLFLFSLVPNVFPLGYFQVLNGFPICSSSSQCVPQHVLHIPYVLANVVLCSPI